MRTRTGFRPRRHSAEVADFLDKLKRAPAAHAGGGRGRLIFALDATASREPTWDRACRIQGEMFEATAALGGLEIQLVFYRGFSECKASRWMTTAADLHRVMRSVFCVGGETQIERVLTHAIRETRSRKVNALVFVGDAMEEKVDRLCRLAGELGPPRRADLSVSRRPRPGCRGGLQADREPVARRLSELRSRQRRSPEGAARRRRGLCRGRLSRADRLWRKEGRRGLAADRAAARVERRRCSTSSAGSRSSAAS